MAQRQLGQDGRGVGRLGEAWIEGELLDDADVALPNSLDLKLSKESQETLHRTSNILHKDTSTTHLDWLLFHFAKVCKENCAVQYAEGSGSAHTPGSARYTTTGAHMESQDRSKGRN
jgi:hypothetical protein